MIRSRHYLWISFLFLVGFLVYSRSFTGGYIWDDQYFIRDNKFLQSGTELPKLFYTDAGAGSDFKYGYYRPLHILSYKLDEIIWGRGVIGHHLTNFFLHVGTAALLYFCVIELLLPITVASLASALYLLHPAQVESVAYMSGRSDPLGAFFMMIVFYAVLKYSHASIGRKQGAWLVAAALSYTAALFSREVSIVFPAILLIYSYLFEKKLPKLFFVWLFGISAAYLAIRHSIYGSILSDVNQAHSSSLGFRKFLSALTGYAQVWISPFNLRADRVGGFFGGNSPAIYTGSLIALASIAVCVWQRRNPIVLFAVSWFYIALLPTSNLLFPVVYYMAEHWLYFPSVGLVILMALGLNYGIRRNGHLRWVSGVGAFLLLIGYAALSYHQIEYWRTERDMALRTLALEPESYRSLYTLGLHYGRESKFDEAIDANRRVLALKPDYANAAYNLGNMYAFKKDFAHAVEAYQQAVRIDADFFEAYHNMAMVYKMDGRPDLAAQAAKQVIAIHPDLKSVYQFDAEGKKLV